MNVMFFINFASTALISFIPHTCTHVKFCIAEAGWSYETIISVFGVMVKKGCDVISENPVQYVYIMVKALLLIGMLHVMLSDKCICIT
jgi:hypothetical protein